MTAQQETALDDLAAGVTRVTARRIGLLADDHNGNEDGSDLPEAVLRAFDGVDLIAHLGHMGVRDVTGRGVLDRLASVAPVFGVRDYTMGGSGEPVLSAAAGERVAGLTRVLDADGMRIGLIHNLEKGPGPAIPTPAGGLPELDADKVSEVVQEKFGGPVDVVAYGSTHRPAAVLAGGVLFVNPGSPTYPKGPGRTPGQRAPGTVGVLTLTGGGAVFETVDVSLFEDSSE